VINRTVSGLLLTAAAAGLLVGCTAGTSTGPETPKQVSATTPAELRTASYPLDRFKLTDADFRAVGLAHAILARNCLRRSGFDVPVPAGVTAGFARGEWNTDYGMVDAEYAAAHGYDAADTTKDAPLFDEAVVAAGPAALRAYRGDSGAVDPSASATSGAPTTAAGGCDAEANRVIYAGMARPTGVTPHDLERDALSRATADSRVRDGIRTWSACMATAGYKFRDVMEPFFHWNQKRPTEGVDKHAAPAISQAEVTMALTDVKCKGDTGLLRTWINVTIEFQTDAVARNLEPLTAYRKNLDLELRNAAAVVAAAK
jgi:hypothetical protein